MSAPSENLELFLDPSVPDATQAVLAQERARLLLDRARRRYQDAKDLVWSAQEDARVARLDLAAAQRAFEAACAERRRRRAQ